MKIEFYRNLYVSERFEKKKEKTIRKILEHKFQTDVYLITLPHGEHNQLEFFDSVLLKQKIFRKPSYFVVGIADGYDEAIFLVEKIMKEVYDETGTLNAREFLEHRR
ncbi:MAG: hypothetical protein PHN80_10435 [Hespellia sp.]|nr:hypothetical protein [Hespellia sp.]